jgi:phage terminase small subunit
MNSKQAQFVREYLIDQNATKAAIRAGYSPKTSGSMGHELLKKPEIAEAIQAGLSDLAQKTGITAERVLNQMARLGFSDIRGAFRETGELKLPGEWDDETAAAIASIEVITVNKGEGMVEYVSKIRLADKRAALADIARVLGINKDSLEITGKDGGPVETVVTYALPDNGR